MSDIICAMDFIDNCQCDECIQKRDASASATNALPGIISQILRENSQLNTQVTELQSKCTAQLEERRQLLKDKLELTLKLKQVEDEPKWKYTFEQAQQTFKESLRYCWDRSGDLNAGKFTNLIAQRLGKQRAMNKALRLDIEESKAENARVRDELVDALNEIDKLNDVVDAYSDDHAVCADHE